MFDVFDLIAFLFFVVWIVLTIRFFIFNPFTVVGQSMEPTFSQWDFIIVDKITPKYGTLERWDILVFVPDGKDVPYIKRIVWLPWETIVIKDGDMFICSEFDQEVVDPKNAKNIDVSWCTKSDESFLKDGTHTLASCKKSVFPIDNEWLFVAWDNRGHSTDSRCCFWSSCYDWANYQVYDKNIIWKVAVKLYPGMIKY